MERSKIISAMEEAAKFIKRCEDCLSKNQPCGSQYIYPSKESGALRRTSMDLTRSLSEMRKP